MNEFEPSFFFFKLPLYRTIKLTADNHFQFEDLFNLGKDDLIDGYNPDKNMDTTFWVRQSEDLKYLERGGIGFFVLNCKRYDDDVYFFINYDVAENKIVKIGQYPSIADFHIHKLKDYRKVLSEQLLSEFSRAIGLAANGIGIGAYVYLRRIFEDCIRSAYKENENNLSISDKEFRGLRVEEKIKTLHNFLPDFLTKNNLLYPILSKGVHELTEEECLKYFDTVKVAIELILDEKLEKLKKNEKIKAVSHGINQIHKEIKSKDSQS